MSKKPNKPKKKPKSTAPVSRMDLLHASIRSGGCWNGNTVIHNPGPTESACMIVSNKVLRGIRTLTLVHLGGPFKLICKVGQENVLRDVLVPSPQSRFQGMLNIYP